MQAPSDSDAPQATTAPCRTEPPPAGVTTDDHRRLRAAGASFAEIAEAQACALAVAQLRGDFFARYVAERCDPEIALSHAQAICMCAGIGWDVLRRSQRRGQTQPGFHVPLTELVEASLRAAAGTHYIDARYYGATHVQVLEAHAAGCNLESYAMAIRKELAHRTAVAVLAGRSGFTPWPALCSAVSAYQRVLADGHPSELVGECLVGLAPSWEGNPCDLVEAVRGLLECEGLGYTRPPSTAPTAATGPPG